jgi:ABC-2 type transport system permease protein
MTTAPLTSRPAAASTARGSASWLTQVVLLTRRNLVNIFRTPEALLPPILISVFFLVIYQSTLGTAAGFIPGLSGKAYLGFILPLSIVSSSLAGSGIAAQNLVKDLENGYFDKLLLNPITYVLTGMRSLMLDGWNGGDLLPAVAACLLLAVAMYGLAGYALRVRTRRK